MERQLTLSSTSYALLKEKLLIELLVTTVDENTLVFETFMHSAMWLLLHAKHKNRIYDR